MARAWSTFLSCDAREMCRPTPALARVFLTWLGAAFRIFTLWLFLSEDFETWLLRASSGMSWMARQDHPDFVSFQRIRREADRDHAAWMRGALSDDMARTQAKELAASLRRWSERRGSDGGLFTESWKTSYDDEPPCRPFDVYQERLALLETQEQMTWGEDCTYLLFTH